MIDVKCYAGKCGHGLSVACLSILSGILAPLIFLLVMIILESLQPGYSPIHDTVSRLVLGLHGWFQTLSFFVFGSLFAVFTWRLYSATLRKSPAVLGAVLFLLSSLGFFILGVFPVDSSKFVLTPRGLVHDLTSSLVVLTFILGCFAFAVYFRRDRRWQKFWWFTVLSAAACFSLSLVWQISPVTWAWRGLTERIVLLTAFVWIEVVSVRLFRYCSGKAPA
jgi:hypothetical membrane protein